MLEKSTFKVRLSYSHTFYMSEWRMRHFSLCLLWTDLRALTIFDSRNNGMLSGCMGMCILHCNYQAMELSICSPLSYPYLSLVAGGPPALPA